MKPVTKGIGHIWRCGTFVVVLVVLVILTGTTGIMGAGYEYKAHISEPGVSLEPAPTGSPAWVRYDENGANLLLWGHEGPNDIRILGRDLATKKVLELPSSGFTVKGVEWGDNHDRIVVWGSPGEGINDSLVFYKSPTWSIEEGLLPDNLLPLIEIDYARFFASDLILSVAGRDVNGTSRVVMIETGPMNILRDNPMMNNRSVVYIGTDDRYMFVLDDSGELIIYSTKDWNISVQMKMLSTPFSAHDIEGETPAIAFGGQDGTVATRFDVEHPELKTFNTGVGPVVGLMYTVVTDGRKYVIAATPEGEASSTLQILDGIEGGNWSRHRNLTIDGRVSMLAMDPRSNTTIVAAFQDGSVTMYELIVERYEVDDTPSKGWLWYAGTALKIVTILVIVIIVYYLMTKRRGRVDELATKDNTPE